MNIEQLQEILIRKGVNEIFYSLGSLAAQSESYSIVQDGSEWKVVYKERGECLVIEAGLSEDEACRLLYRMFEEFFGWLE
ncbi:hypothetical protein Q6A51_01385 [Pseudomonas sp. KFB-139]|uniref:Uncharacterized protein n=1 Tax=Pseudomonas serbiensis TaxID=3064350 RepID=A0ABT9CIU6_9PSED|nr:MULTISPECIES: hypothetical protein [Pseudomonas]MBX8528742.1 hypothetical protein [Pseudomonas cichorii]MDO7925411.1 hypothetical protein [Pseudomonas sp. KFB-138]